MKKNQSVSDIEQHRLAENVGVLADAAAGATRQWRIARRGPADDGG